MNESAMLLIPLSRNQLSVVSRGPHQCPRGTRKRTAALMLMYIYTMRSEILNDINDINDAVTSRPGMVPAYHSSGAGWVKQQHQAAASAKRKQTKRAPLISTYRRAAEYSKPPVSADVKFAGEALKKKTAEMFLAPPRPNPPRVVVRMGYSIAGNVEKVPDAAQFAARPPHRDFTMVFPGKVILRPVEIPLATETLLEDTGEVLRLCPPLQLRRPPVAGGGEAIPTSDPPVR